MGGYNKNRLNNFGNWAVGMGSCGEGWRNWLARLLLRIGSITTKFLVRPGSLAKIFDPFKGGRYLNRDATGAGSGTYTQ